MIFLHSFNTLNIFPFIYLLQWIYIPIWDYILNSITFSLSFLFTFALTYVALFHLFLTLYSKINNFFLAIAFHSPISLISVFLLIPPLAFSLFFILLIKLNLAFVFFPKIYSAFYRAIAWASYYYLSLSNSNILNFS